MRDQIALLPLDRLSTSDFASYRDKRLRKVKAVTVNRELGLVQHCLTLAREEWDIPLEENPVARLRRPLIDSRRERRLRPGEYECLLASARRSRNALMLPLIIIAVETGMRQGELLRARWDHLDASNGLLAIPITKNGYPRSVPLSAKAMAALSDLRAHGGDRLFPLTPSAVKQAWRRIVRRASLDDLHFHDLRHEAISRFIEIGLTVSEAAMLSGHRDHRMLLRYTHAQPVEIGRKLRLSQNQAHPGSD